MQKMYQLELCTAWPLISILISVDQEDIDPRTDPTTATFFETNTISNYNLNTCAYTHR